MALEVYAYCINKVGFRLAVQHSEEAAHNTGCGTVVNLTICQGVVVGRNSL